VCVRGHSLEKISFQHLYYEYYMFLCVVLHVFVCVCKCVRVCVSILFFAFASMYVPHK